MTESPKCILSCGKKNMIVIIIISACISYIFTAFSLLDSFPQLKEMVIVLEELVDWKEFGIHLGIEYHEIERIKKENRSIDDSKIKLYNYWLNADTTASWQKVINALERMKLKTLSSQIRRKHCSQTCNSDTVHS